MPPSLRLRLSAYRALTTSYVRQTDNPLVSDGVTVRRPTVSRCRRQNTPDLILSEVFWLIRWWAGAGSNRRPTVFQA
jgi:hypothetical protein